jgi:D-alanine-D-alanine ligase
VRRNVALWTGEYQYTIDQVLAGIIERCRELDLRLVESEERTKLDFTILLTVQTMHYLHSGKHRVWLWKKLRVLALMHAELIPPGGRHGTRRHTGRLEDGVCRHYGSSSSDTRSTSSAVHEDLPSVRKVLEEWKPHIVFNLLEHVHAFRPSISTSSPIWSCRGIPYTELQLRAGCCSAATRAVQEAAERIIAFRCPTSRFFPIGRAVRRPKRLGFPLIVEVAHRRRASVGISQASVVDDDDSSPSASSSSTTPMAPMRLRNASSRGVSCYVGILGNSVCKCSRMWEDVLSPRCPRKSWRIATDRVKWRPGYQKKHGIDTDEAKDLRLR